MSVIRFCSTSARFPEVRVRVRVRVRVKVMVMVRVRLRVRLRLRLGHRIRVIVRVRPNPNPNPNPNPTSGVLPNDIATRLWTCSSLEKARLMSSLTPPLFINSACISTFPANRASLLLAFL